MILTGSYNATGHLPCRCTRFRYLAAQPRRTLGRVTSCRLARAEAVQEGEAVYVVSARLRYKMMKLHPRWVWPSSRKRAELNRDAQEQASVINLRLTLEHCYEASMCDDDGPYSSDSNLQDAGV
ncbi:hypothetical protein MN608_08033 [Microdochium nivale]|nr:hypothetical protein MN608_08033 [Microdochium nivale]